MEYIPAKHIVTKTKSNDWFGCDYTMNIYRGCAHGCIYCDSRSDCYRIKDFDIVKAKQEALAIIRDDLRGKVKKGVVCTGAMSDPYNCFENELMLTRKALSLIDTYGFGTGIATKSTLITRDIDILRDISAHSPVIAKITITANDDVCKIIEPNAPLSSERFAAINKLTENKIFAGVLMMPILPFITDTKDNVKNIVRLAYEYGARFIYPAFGVTLRDGQRDYFFDKLDNHYPYIKERYIETYKGSYSCVSKNAKALWGIFADECEKYRIQYSMKGIVKEYKHSYDERQMRIY